MDNIKINVLEDGTIRSETDPVSGANHSNAEEFLNQMSKLAGGESNRVKRGGHHNMGTHTHDETHQH